MKTQPQASTEYTGVPVKAYIPHPWHAWQTIVIGRWSTSGMLNALWVVRFAQDRSQEETPRTPHLPQGGGLSFCKLCR